MWSVSYKPSALAGIAIQPENIHLVQLKKVRKGYLIERVRRFVLPPKIFSRGKIIAFAELQSHLAEVVKTEGLHNMRTAVCVSANQVKMQRITLPAGLPDIDIEAEICTRVYRSLPAKNDPLAIDFRVRAAAKSQEESVFFAAARKEYIHQYHECMQAAGLKVVMMDVDIFALLRAVRFALHHHLANDEKLCALYIGDNYAVIAAQQDDDILFYQQWDGENDTSFAMTRTQWIEWCCQTYQQMNIQNVAIGGRQDVIYAAVKIISSKWKCKIYEPDPFLPMLGASGADKIIMNDSPSTFLLACGLAMREVQV